MQATQAESFAGDRLRGTVWAHRTSIRRFYALVLELGAALGRRGITADGLTYASLAFAAGAGLLAGSGAFAWAAVAVLLSGLCDVLDGAVARATGRATAYGALLDSTVDRFADGFPLLGLVAALSQKSFLALLPAAALLGSLVVPYVRARTEALGATIPPLFMRRAERTVLLALSLAVGEVRLGVLPAPLLLIGLGLLAILSIAGALRGLMAARLALTERLPATEVERSWMGPTSRGA